MKFHPPILFKLRAGHPAEAMPHIFVETGTWHGTTTAMAGAFFLDVHTIERAPIHFLRAWDKFLDIGNVHCHFGDSRTVLAALCALLPTEPVFFYLDAHWFRVDAVVGEGEFPLWEEIEAIAGRGAQDTVVIDDVHSFGTGNPEEAWLDVTLENILKAFREAGRECTGWEEEGCDQVAVYLH